MTKRSGLHELSARDLAAKIATGDVSAVEAIDAHIEHIEDVNPALNAVVVRRYDEARAEAREADRRRGAGEPMGALQGVPITVKESLDVAGTPSTFGIGSRARVLADRDDPFVARLRDAGAIVVGKTNVAQLLLYLESDNPLYGRTNNPWDLERTPGGSSGGQAAIIAAGGSPLGLGTDIGGSVRVPATFCGITSMKPTAGRMNDQGRFSIPIGQRAIVSQVGVMARDVADVSLGLELANGGRNPDAEPPMPLPDPTAVDVTALRVAYFTDDGIFPAAPAVRRAVEEAASALERSGATVLAWRPPEIPHALDLFYGLLAGDGARGFKRILGRDERDRRVADIERGAAMPGAALPAIRALLRASGRAELAAITRNYGDHSTDHHWRLVEALMDYQARFRRGLDEHTAGPIDVILSPACALPAFRHGATGWFGLAGAYTAMYNVLGYPAGVVPFSRVRSDEESDRSGTTRAIQTAIATERGSAGLPVGVQVAALPWREHVALSVMARLEEAARATPDFPRTPVDPISQGAGEASSR